MTVVRDSLIPGLGGKVDIHMCAFARRCVNVCFREGKDSVMGCLHKTEGPRVSVLARRATSSHTVSGREPSAGSRGLPTQGPNQQLARSIPQEAAWACGKVWTLKYAGLESSPCLPAEALTVPEACFPSPS